MGTDIEKLIDLMIQELSLIHILSCDSYPFVDLPPMN